MKLSETLIVGTLSALIGAGASIATSSLNYFNSSRELDIRMVNVALNILSAKEKGTDTEQARRYALRALEYYGGIAIPNDEFEQWAKTGTVPTGIFPLNWDLVPDQKKLWLEQDTVERPEREKKTPLLESPQ